MKIIACAVLGLSLLAAACASSSANDATLGASASSATATRAEPAALTGTWAFAIGASDVAAPLRERCKQSSHDATKTEECWSDIQAEAAQEKIRFATDGAGHTVWTSFAKDGPKESVFVEVPVELASDGPGHVLAKVAGVPKGDRAAEFAKASINVMRIEVVDAKTIAMTDPKKGRLVFTKE